MRETPMLAVHGLRTGTLDAHVVCYLFYSFSFERMPVTLTA